MPPDSTDRFLTAPVRAAKISRRYLHLISCQEPTRRPLRPLRPPGLFRILRPLGPLGLSGLLKPSV